MFVSNRWGYRGACNRGCGIVAPSRHADNALSRTPANAIDTKQASTEPASRAEPVEPLVAELDRSLRPEEAFAAFADEPHVVFFDSALRDATLGRYSYVAADPIAWRVDPADGSPALSAWRDRLSRWPARRVPGLPPWQGGDAGVLGYEIGRSLERLPRPAWDEFKQPALAVGTYDTVIAFDHEADRCWAISHGVPEPAGTPQRERAERRLAWLLGKLANGPAPTRLSNPSSLSREQLAPSHATPYGRGVVSDFSREGYLRAVERVVEHLRAGDAFQVNLSQRLLAEAPDDPVDLYLRLRDRNPAPFAGYVDGGDWLVASASPERFLRVDERVVETRPIKGTRPLTGDDAVDAAVGEQLRSSEKDRAENVMIVDLLRSDLSRVCTDESVDVPTLFGLERYRHVQHLVSVVTGRLREECGVAELLAATLPGGSITGAPKVRAQEIIAALEPTARGAYCGSLVWVGFPDEHGRQAMDSSVLIRTLTASRGWVQAPVGGGVVVQSDPVAEYDETWHKAAGLIDAVGA